jgi:hypothetical protein
MKRRLPLSLAARILVLPALAGAQSNLLFSSSGQTVTIAGNPFQGKLTGRMVQKIADGMAVMQDVQGQMARDSNGRVLMEEQHADQPISAEVLDPVSRTSLEWTSASTTVTRTTPLSRFPWHVIFSSQPLLEAYELETERREPEKVTTEDLGKKIIGGLATTGTRTTTVVPTGKIVHEVWFSKDLKLAVLDTFTDETGVRQTIEIREVTRTEPDPALFRPPPGYTVKQRALPGQIGGGGVAGATGR